jgi:DMSO/TMAO reductase YedYZ molybdopterin-dependent catalytic subunit
MVAGAATPATESTPHGSERRRDLATTGDENWGKLTHDQPILTPSENLFVAQYDRRRTPLIDAANWRLQVEGLVAQPLTLTLDEVRALPALDAMWALACISNPAGGDLVGNVRVTGADLTEVLRRVGVRDEATFVTLTGADGYVTSVALDWLRQPGVMLAYAMNGEPLTAAHGFPLRLVIPGVYGQKQPRWITHITLADHEALGFWESRGYSRVAEVKTSAIIHAPTDGSEIVAGSAIYVQGVALAGRRRITAVELQVDDGEWFAAQIVPPPSDAPFGWTQWFATWTPPAAGPYRLGVRATDESGFVQVREADERLSAAPDGSDAIHRITIYVA